MNKGQELATRRRDKEGNRGESEKEEVHFLREARAQEEKREQRREDRRTGG